MPPSMSSKNGINSGGLSAPSKAPDQSNIPLNKHDSPISSAKRRKAMKRLVKTRIAAVIEKHPDLPLACAVTADWERRELERECEGKKKRSDLRVSLGVGYMRYNAHLTISRSVEDILKLKQESGLDEIDLNKRIAYELKGQCRKKLGLDDKE
ncbi:hypothetical protein PMAYCL1PPCAC_33076, partial [Pristionchus mayeri]